MLVLAACDTTGIEPVTQDIVGAWLLDDVSSRDYVTPAADATFPDLLVPGDGEVTVSDPAAPSLQYLVYVLGDLGPETRQILLTSNPPVGTGNRRSYSELRLYASGQAQLSFGGQGYGFSYSTQTDQPFTLTRSSLTVPEIRFETEELGTIRVGGQIDFVVRQLEAGVETVISPWYIPVDPPNYETRFVFEPGGVYRNEITYGNRTTSLAGLWDATDDSLRVSLTTSDQTVTTAYRYRFVDEDLVLSAEPTPCRAGCVADLEDRLYLPPGTLSASRAEVTYRYVPSQSRALAASGDDADEPVRLHERLHPNAPGR